MSDPEQYDVVVLGSGAGGKLLAWTLASQGKRMAVIERRYVGGSCPNIACLPSKNVIHGAKVANYFRRGAEFGIATGDWKVDMAAVRDRKRKMVDGLVAMHHEKYRESGAELVMGQGRFVAPKTIEVALNAGGTRTLRGETVVINTGSRARIDDTPGLAEARPLTHVEALELDQLPEHLIVLGGGYVGPRAGAGVSPLRQPRDRRRAERLADPPRRPGRDRGDRAALPGRRDRGPDRDRASIASRGDPASPFACHDGAAATIEGTHLLVAGRPHAEHRRHRPREGRGRDGRAGHVKVNERLQTTAEGVWAVGDCAGSPYFTHIGEDDFRVVLDNLSGGDRVTTGRQVPFCLFTDPELARVGLSETRGPRARRSPTAWPRSRWSRVLRARTLSETRGFLKALIEDGQRPHPRASPRSGPRPAKSWPSSRSRCSAACPTRRSGTRS